MFKTFLYGGIRCNTDILGLFQNSDRHFKACKSIELTIYTVETFEISHITIQQKGI